MEELIQLFSFL